MGRFRRTALTGVGLTPIVGAGLLLGWFWCGVRHAQRLPADVPLAPFQLSLDDLCHDNFRAEWRIKHPPDLPGPYVRRLPGFLYYHAEGVSMTVRLRERSGAVAWEERTRPGVEFLTLVLETSDGLRAHGLLVRGE